MEVIPPRHTFLDAVIPLFHLNQYARAPFIHRYHMIEATQAIYWMKHFVIREALRHNLCWIRGVEVERPCKVCNGTGVFKRYLDYDEEEYLPEDCRRCCATGNVKLKFAETTICGVRWHTPRPKADGLPVDWDRCESTNWMPEQPGRELALWDLICLLNEAERAIFGPRLIPSPDLVNQFHNPLGYMLHLGILSQCFVCGYNGKATPLDCFDRMEQARRWRQH